MHDLFAERDDVVLVNERHLDVELRELGLTVCAEVLVAVAAGDLVVALHAAHHEQLLEQLRRLRQRVPGTRRQPRGHQEVSRALWRGARERRRLDLEEVVAVEHSPGGGVCARPHDHRGARCRAAQVEVAVLEAGLFANGYVLVDGERRGRGRVEDDDVGANDLDLARGKVGVGGTLRAQAHLSGDLDDELVAQFVRDVLAQHHLGKARRVAQVDEGDSAVITSARHPAGERHGGAGVGGTKGTCEVGAEHGRGLSEMREEYGSV